MRIRDIALMAVHNLWSQKMRTLLNLLGVVISSVLLLMTFAATRGASDGIMNIINSSDQTRQFMIVSSRNPNTPVPASAIKVEGDVNPEQRKRFAKALRKKWIAANAKRIYLTADILGQLRSIEGVASIIPRKPLNCQLSLGQQSTSGSLLGISLNDSSIKNRLACGKIPAWDDRDGILLDEYTAYKLGYHSQQQLENLVGTSIRAVINVGPANTTANANLLRALGPAASQIDLTTLARFSSSVKRLAEKADEVGLNDEEKDALQLGLKQLSIFAQASPPEKPSPASSAVESPSKMKPNEREFIVRGVVKRPGEQEGPGFLQFAGPQRLASVYIDSREKEPFNFQHRGFAGFWTATGEVKSTDQLATVVGKIEAMGLEVRSAVAIIEKLETEVGKARLAIGALALLILLVAALGISNTMIIAVIERTPEFGIMKSLGASDGQVLWLLLLEGLITGILGAAIALAVSMAASPIASEICRQYIENRLRSSFDQSIFLFAPTDVLIVFLLSGIVCTVASLLPAWRAAKLDPVVAMKR
jgi:putative ABC transport system permease protein